MDTIFAQATAQGRAGVCVIRISGPQAFFIAESIAQPLPAPRVAAVRAVSDADGQVIDRALVLTFEGPNSFTGEDTVELHLHGSIAVVRAVLALLSGFDGTRLAEPGEFTRRAMENGKLDLTQVEGLGDLIEAETEAQRKQALRVLSGHLGQKVDIWREKLIRAAALLEVTIDFADEDVPVDVSPEVTELLNAVNADILAEIAGTSTSPEVLFGIGLNLDVEQESLREHPGLSEQATSIRVEFGHSPSPEQALQSILSNLDRLIEEDHSKGGRERNRLRVAEVLDTIGRHIHWKGPADRTGEGEATGISPEGALIVERTSPGPPGEEQLRSAEISHVRIC